MAPLAPLVPRAKRCDALVFLRTAASDGRVNSEGETKSSSPDGTDNRWQVDEDQTWTTGPQAPGRRGEPLLTRHLIVADRFRVVRFLARGGMGEVYEVQDQALGTRVALKLLRSEYAGNDEAIERLKREIHLAREVTHRNVCRIFDLVNCHIPQKDAAPRVVLGLTMELLKGETLAERLQHSGKMSPDEALPLVFQMAAALDAAHSVGVVHRDFKCSNVMLVKGVNDDEERVVVTDFGVARPVPARRGSSSPITTANMVVGTADYMAPEQAEGADVTPASDIYALGVVMFEMVTGSRPHTGSTPLAVLMQRAKAGPRSPRDLVPDLAPLWDEVITRCLAREPSDRFASAAEVAAVLSDSTLSQVFPVNESTAPTGPTRDLPAATRPRLRWWRSPWLAIGVVSVVAGLSFLGLWSRNRRIEQPIGPPVTRQLTTWATLEIDPDISPDDRLVVFSANRDGRFELFTREIDDPHRTVQLTDDGEQNFQPTFSPDGSTIAYASHGRGGVWLLPAAGGTPQRITDFGSHPSWSPDGQSIAFQSDAAAVLSANAVHAMPPSTLWVIDVDGKTPRQITQAGQPNGGHGAPVWAANGSRLVFTASDRRWSRIYSVAHDGSDLKALVTGVSVAVDPAITDDGRSLYYTAVGDDERYGVWRLEIDPETTAAQGQPECLLSPGIAGVRNIALSRGGTRIVHSAMVTTSNLWYAVLSQQTFDPVGRPTALTTGSGRYSRPAFSPDGRWVAFDSWQVGADQDIWILPTSGGKPQRITTSPSPDTRAGWWPDGSALVFMSGRDGCNDLWRRSVESGEVRRIASFAEDVDWIRLSPDGQRLAYHATRDGATNIWTASSDGSHRRQLTFDREVMGYPTWSPDSRSLAFEMKRGDDDHVMVLDLTGGEPKQLTFEPGKSWPYDFSPDGDKVVFARLRNGLWNIWWVSRSTLEQNQLTHFDDLNGYVRYPAWAPTGDRVVFERAQSTGDLWLVDGLPKR